MRNDSITGPQNAQYDEGWERTFGKKRPVACPCCRKKFEPGTDDRLYEDLCPACNEAMASKG